MKLERLTIHNFLRLAELDVDLSTHPVHLFCGPNEAGKSTVAEAIRFAVLGDSPRVALKKNYERLVHSGAKKGSVSLMFGGAQVTRNVGTGQTESPIPLDEAAETSARIAFGAQDFVDLKPDERRSFLFKLTQIKVTEATTNLPRFT
jgi:recombinational DNA repair ATPase RecF